jgi:aldehyde:ferredoxin oxidoreductase
MLNEKFIRVLYIDLDTERMRIEQREDLMAYLGGVGVASKLFLENIKPDLDILAPEQPIVFAIGAGAYVFPVLTKTVAMFISPLTGELGESYAGGRFAMAMLLAGYDALVITGKAKRYSYISLSNQSFNIRDARAMWGLKVKTSTQNIRERENLGGHAVDKRSILTIGPGGESGVAFASVTTDIYRHFGRLGLGACFGSKNLKAIMVFGNRSLPILNPKTYHKVYREIYDKCTGTDNMAKYHDVGTPINVLPLSKAGALPTLNLSTCTYEYAEDVSGEAFAHKNLVRKMACVGCPVGCIHIGMYRREFDKGHEYEAINVPYDYELIFALGSFIGIKTTDEIIAVIEETEALGLDAMSTGVCLGWATEALAKGFITKQDTIVDLQFGDSAAYKEAIRYLSSGANTFYQDLG